MTMYRPDQLIILGNLYEVVYCDDSADIDPHDNRPDRKQHLLGWSSKWDHQIRVYDDGDDGEVLDTLVHEIAHLVADDLCPELNEDELHPALARLATGIADTLLRNGMVAEFEDGDDGTGDDAGEE